MSTVENKLKDNINELITQKAESSETVDLSDSEHGYVDALIWLKEGSIQLTKEGVEKERLERKYADPEQSTVYYDGYDSALKQVLKMIEKLTK